MQTPQQYETLVKEQTTALIAHHKKVTKLNRRLLIALGAYLTVVLVLVGVFL